MNTYESTVNKINGDLKVFALGGLSGGCGADGQRTDGFCGRADGSRSGN